MPLGWLGLVSPNGLMIFLRLKFGAAEKRVSSADRREISSIIWPEFSYANFFFDRF